MEQNNKNATIFKKIEKKKFARMEVADFWREVIGPKIMFRYVGKKIQADIDR
jgi:hypothetical protein